MYKYTYLGFDRNRINIEFLVQFLGFLYHTTAEIFVLLVQKVVAAHEPSTNVGIEFNFRQRQAIDKLLDSRFANLRFQHVSDGSIQDLMM